MYALTSRTISPSRQDIRLCNDPIRLNAHSNNKIEDAVEEISRVTEKVIVITETCNSTVPLKSHCFIYDLKALFQKHFSGKLVGINERTCAVTVGDLAQAHFPERCFASVWGTSRYKEPLRVSV